MEFERWTRLDWSVNFIEFHCKFRRLSRVASEKGRGSFRRNISKLNSLDLAVWSYFSFSTLWKKVIWVNEFHRSKGESSRRHLENAVPQFALRQLARGHRDSTRMLQSPEQKYIWKPNWSEIWQSLGWESVTSWSVWSLGQFLWQALLQFL